MHFDCIVKQFIIGYLVVVYLCIANHFPAHNHHHHVWCMSILPTNVEAPTSSSNVTPVLSLPYCHCFSICCSTYCRYHDRGSNYRHTANLWWFRCITSVNNAVYTYSGWAYHDVLSTISEHLNKAADILQQSHCVKSVTSCICGVDVCLNMYVCMTKNEREREREMYNNALIQCLMDPSSFDHQLQRL